ncbi:MAG: AMP-binding protein [Mycobacterium sp.]
MSHSAIELPSVNALIVSALQQFPDRVAFAQGDRTITYRQAADLTARLVAALKVRGVGPGRVVGILAANGPEAWLTQSAVQLLGGITVGLHAKASVEDHAYVCRDAGLALLVTDEKFAEPAAMAVTAAGVDVPLAVLGASPDHPDLLAEAGTQSGGRLVAGPTRSCDLVEILYTGGTTGRSKGVMQTHRARSAITLLAPMAYELPLAPVYLACSPITHAAAHFVLPTLLRGGTVVLTDGFDPDEFATTVQRRRVNLTFAVPSMIYKLLDHLGDGVELPSLQRLVYGASPMSGSRLAEGHARFGDVFTQIYGQTETLALGTVLRSDEHDFTDPARLASCGRVVPGMSLALLDDDGRQVPDGEMGEICLRGPGVMAGYLGQPDVTAEALAGGWLHTGDMARADDQGYLTIVDRKKDFIISGGFNVYSREVEDILTAHPAVATAAVVGVPDPVWGEAVKAVIVLRSGHHVDTDELAAAVRAAKGPVATPKSFDVVDDLPVTALGKTDKKILRARYWRDRDRAVN